MKISAALIVKNEEKYLARCLDSIKDQVDEIIIVDTGSTDKTLAIAKRYTDKVYYYKWHDDFAAARNNAFSYATGDYILSIDADEYLISKNIKDELDGSEGIYCNLIWEGDKSTHSTPRIFKKGLKWVGKCHETIVCNTKKQSNIEIIYGHSPTHADDPERNLRILKSIKEPNARDFYYLSRESFHRKLYEDAITYADKCIEKTIWRYEKADAYLTAARCLFYLQRGDEARDYCLKAIMLDPEFKEALHFMGELSWEKEQKTWQRYAEIATNENVIFIRRL